MKELEQRVRKILELALNIAIDEKDNFERTNNTQWDSVKHVEIIFLLEDEFDVQFDESEFELLKDIEATANLIAQKRG